MSDVASSPPKETVELKAGHAPAVKVGGMRVVQHKPPKAEEPKMSAEDKQEFGEDPKKAPAPDSVLVSGVFQMLIFFYRSVIILSCT